MNPIVQTVLGWVLPVVLGPLVYFAARELLNVSRRIDDLPPLVKRFAVVALGTLVAAGLHVLGGAVPLECVTLAEGVLSPECATALNAPTVVRGVTAGLVAMILHYLKKSRPNA